MAVKDIDNLTVDDIKPITVSFKKSKEDLILYKWILKHSGYSSFIKDALRDLMKSEGSTEFSAEIKTQKAKPNQIENNNLIELDF